MCPQFAILVDFAGDAVDVFLCEGGVAEEHIKCVAATVHVFLTFPINAWGRAWRCPLLFLVVVFGGTAHVLVFADGTTGGRKLRLRRKKGRAKLPPEGYRAAEDEVLQGGGFLSVSFFPAFGFFRGFFVFFERSMGGKREIQGEICQTQNKKGKEKISFIYIYIYLFIYI